MKKMGLLIAGLMFASSSAYAAGDHHAAATGSNDTVKLVVVDKTSKPFKRTVETLTVTDIAAMEEARTNNAADPRDRIFAKRFHWR